MHKIKIKHSITNKILVWIIVLISASANEITTWNSTMVLAMLLTMMVFLERGKRIDRVFIFFTIMYFVVYAIHVFKFGYVDLREFREYLKILYAYMFIKLVYKDFFKIYVDIIYKLAIISLPLYLFQLIDYQMMKSVIGIVEHNISFLDYRGDWYENLFFFTLNDNGMYRNSGFAWEPKGFGTFLTLAIFIQLFLNKFKLLDKKIIIYLVAIATTLSTATYSVVFLGILPFYIYNRGISFKVFAPILIFPIVFIVFTKLDFMEEKILHEYETRDKYVAYAIDRSYKGESRSLGRFGSLILDYNDVIKEPLVGYGLFSEERTRYSVTGVKLVRVNGLSDLLAKFGFIGILLYMLLYFSSFKKIAFQFKFKGFFIIPIGIFLTSFASAILLKPLYLALLLYGMINQKK